jgi:hypothetical protein
MRASFFVAITLSLPAVASAHIVLPGTQPLEAGSAFTLSSGCASCHGGYDDAGDYEASDGFLGSPHAHALESPLFRAAFALAELDKPGIGDFCIKCHSPSAWLEGRAALSDGSLLYPTDRGVECSFCHRLIDGDPLGPLVSNGMFFVDDDPTYGGPFADALDVAHPVEAREYLASEKMCAVCHEQSSVLHPMRDAKGDVIYAEFPVDRTYSEWAMSDFAREGTTCIDCHMPEEPGFAAGDAAAPARDVHRHEWNAADTLLAELLPEFDPGLDAEVADALVLGAERARDSLASAASLEVLTPEVSAGGPVQVVVRVTNHAGHKIPTGWPIGRRMWLEVTITDAAGVVRDRSGHYDDATDDIEFDADQRIFEVRHGIATVGPTYETVLADMVMTDSRIPPRGFDPPADRTDILSLGRGLSLPDALVNQDDGKYDFDLPCGARGALHVVARLLYQRATNQYVDWLREEPEAGEALHDAWVATSEGAPVEMTRVEADVAVVACPESDAGDGDDPWDGIGPAVRRDGGPPPPSGDVPEPERYAGRLPGGGCSCRAPGTFGAWPALAMLGLAPRRRSRILERG